MNQGSGQRRASSGFFLVTLLLACVALSNQVAALMHTLGVAHVRCEHGHWVHAEDAPEPAPSAEASPVPGESVTTWRSSPRPEAHDHEHCAHASPAGTTASLPEERLLLAQEPTAAPVAMELPLRERLIAQAAIYAFAPKTSPPRAL